jgi:hypothetical protein
MEKESTGGKAAKRSKESPPAVARHDDGGSQPADSITAPPAAIRRPMSLSIPEGSPPPSSTLPAAPHELADSLGSSDSRPGIPQPHSRSARSPQEQAETSFSTIHLAASSNAPNAVDLRSMLPSVEELPALLDEAPCSMRRLAPQLRSVFGIPHEDPGLVDWSELVAELPIEQEFLDVATGLQEASVQKWKEMRAAVLPGRRHWIHRMVSPPRREAWLKAMENEGALMEQEVAILTQKRHDLRTAIEAAAKKRDQRVDDVNRLQIAAVMASAAVKKRDQLQHQYELLRREADEFREVEQELHRRVVAQLANSKPDVVESSPPPVDREELTPAQAAHEDEMFFDAHHQTNSSTRDLAFLSPSLRASVSDALRPGQGMPSQMDADSPQQQTSELRRLATSLQDYLNSEGSPNASARADLLSQVRKAREAVESRRSLTRRTDSVGGGSGPISGNQQEGAILKQSVVGSFVRHPVPSSNSLRVPSSSAPRQPLFDNIRDISTGSTGGALDATRYVDVHSFQRQPASPHRYELAGVGHEAAITFDDVTAAERAVPFFQR